MCTKCWIIAREGKFFPIILGFHSFCRQKKRIKFKVSKFAVFEREDFYHENTCIKTKWGMGRGPTEGKRSKKDLSLKVTPPGF